MVFAKQNSAQQNSSVEGRKFQSIPVIDLGVFCDPNSSLEQRQQTADLVGHACENVGFFLIVNHGVQSDLISAMVDQTKQFFALPEEVKNNLSMKTAGGLRGYFAVGDENLHQDGDTFAIDQKEGFDIGFDSTASHLKDFPEHVMLNKFPPNWDTSVVIAYRNELLELGKRLSRAFALSLGLKEGHFLEMFHDPMCTLRQLHYPPAPSDDTDIADSYMQSIKNNGLTGNQSENNSSNNNSSNNNSNNSSNNNKPPRLGCGAHTDYGFCTILFQDNTGGLQAQNSAKQWVDVPCVENSFVVNIGDMLQRWTNRRFCSTVHRVRSNAKSDRYSLPFFCNPSVETVVSCLPTCCSAENPSSFPAESCGKILLGRYAPTMAHLKKQ